MNALPDNLGKVGIRKRPKSPSAPAVATTTLALAHGATTPAAAEMQYVKVKTFEYRAQWSMLSDHEAVRPSKVDPIVGEAAQALAASLGFAEIVHKVMPVDEAMDRRAESALRRHIASLPSRKLKRK